MGAPTPLAKKSTILKAAIPPSVEEQDFLLLWALSYIVPFFALRFVFELTRRFVLRPARLAVRFAPGGALLLTWMWVTMAPLLSRAFAAARARLPPMEDVNAAVRLGAERWFSALQTAFEKAWPHVQELAVKVQSLKFREAAREVVLVVKAYGPMLLLVVPFVTESVRLARQVWLRFWRFSKTAMATLMGGVLRRSVQGLGKSLAENSDQVAERVAGVLGPIIALQISVVLVVVVGVWIGLIDHDTLATFYVAWIFRLLGLVQDPATAAAAAAAAAASAGSTTAASVGAGGASGVAAGGVGAAAAGAAASASGVGASGAAAGAGLAAAGEGLAASGVLGDAAAAVGAAVGGGGF